MARVTSVAKAQKNQGQCRKCSAKIKKGDSYKWFANRMGRMSIRKNFCANCKIRASDMTTSDKLSTLYSAQEALEDGLPGAESFEDIASLLREAAEAAKEVGQEYADSLSNMPEGLQQGDVGQEIQEKSENCESWADELDSAADDIDNMSDEEPDATAECTNCQHPYSEHKDGGKCEHEKDGDEEEDCDCPEFEAESDKLEEARTQADEACGNLSV